MGWKKPLTIFAAFLTLLIGSSLQSMESTQYWMKLKADDKFERSVIADTGVAIEAIGDDYVTATGSLEELRRLEDLGFVDVSFALTEKMDFPTKDAPYHNYAEMRAALDSMAQTYPNLVQPLNIGKTIEGRDIVGIRISGQLAQASTLPGVFFMGGHHAREHLSVEMPLRFAQWLLAEYAKGNSRIVNLVNNRDIHIIPAVNPDGLEYDIATGSYKMWRKNRRQNSNGTYGVDLNRNYGYQWGGGGASSSPGSDTFRGPSAFSEPETQAIKNHVEANENITILLSFHTFSKLILYPWGFKYDSLAEARDLAVHETMAKKMASWNGYTPQQSSDLYVTSGDTTDWSYGEHKIISFTFELDPANTGFGGGGFYPGAGIIDSVIQKNTEPCLYLIEFADNPYRSIDNITIGTR